jgi:membrane protein required for beta-lactamase induction
VEWASREVKDRSGIGMLRTTSENCAGCRRTMCRETWKCVIRLDNFFADLRESSMRRLEVGKIVLIVCVVFAVLRWSDFYESDVIVFDQKVVFAKFLKNRTN